MPVVGVSRNKTLLVDSGQDSVVLAQAFDCSRFPLVQGESFSDLSCLTCAHRAVRLASSVSNSTSPCNERTWNAKGTDTIMTSPEIRHLTDIKITQMSLWSSYFDSHSIFDSHAIRRNCMRTRKGSRVTSSENEGS